MTNNERANIMSNTLKVEIKYAYGNELIYPRCEKSELFVRLMGSKTISYENAKLINRLGFNFETINKNVQDLQKSL
tara:strand:+ start:286 stop:513 length:228 start_codon:yes stop_codon:yes gene_type:complete